MIKNKKYEDFYIIDNNERIFLIAVNNDIVIESSPEVQFLIGETMEAVRDICFQNEYALKKMIMCAS